ncbi:MAG: hypothetical protein WC809_16565 [Sinimarinibacterium sp.]|jgi:hypothetical protein
MRTDVRAASLLAALFATPSVAADLDLRLEAEGRWFYHAERAAWSPSAAATAEVFHEWHGGRERIVGEVFGRVDARDDERSHADLRELYYAQIGEDVEFRAGLRRVYWGVAESRHLVDIINQSDFVEDLDNEIKLGQPMLNVAFVQTEAGTLELFLMPLQRERTFPGERGHPQLPYPVEPDEARYASKRGRHHLDAALRYQASFGALDLGVSYFDGTARDPDILPCLRRGSGYAGTETQANCDLLSAIEIPQSPLPDALTDLLQEAGLLPSDEEVREQIIADVERNLVLVPYYDRLRQFGVDLQFLVGGWAWKLEALHRDAGKGSSNAAVGGFEYSFSGFFDTAWDVGLLAELLYEDRDSLLDTRYDHDGFVGLRVQLNDIASTMLLGGVLFDRSGEDRVFQLEGNRRLGEDWRLNLKWRDFSAVPRDQLSNFLADEDMLSMSLERFF